MPLMPEGKKALDALTLEEAQAAMDEFRISDVVRYENDFTAPREEFSTDDATRASSKTRPASFHTYIFDAKVYVMRKPYKTLASKEN